MRAAFDFCMIYWIKKLVKFFLQKCQRRPGGIRSQSVPVCSQAGLRCDRNQTLVGNYNLHRGQIWIKRVFWKFPFFCYQEVLVTYHFETSHGEWKLSCQSIYAWHVLVFLDIDIIWSSPFAIITFMIYYHCMWCYYHCIEYIMSMIIKENIFFTITIHVTFLMIALIKRLCFVGYKPSWSWGSRWVDCQVLRGEVRGGASTQQWPT